jgi:hypothetical protein
MPRQYTFADIITGISDTSDASAGPDTSGQNPNDPSQLVLLNAFINQAETMTGTDGTPTGTAITAVTSFDNALWDEFQWQ